MSELTEFIREVFTRRLTNAANDVAQELRAVEVTDQYLREPVELVQTAAGIEVRFVPGTTSPNPAPGSAGVKVVRTQIDDSDGMVDVIDDRPAKGRKSPQAGASAD